MKTNKAKRILTGALAAAMSLSLSVPAFATTTTTPNKETAITGSFEEIPIAVTVPKTGTAKINPYGMPVTFEDSGGNKKTIAGQITTTPYGIVNEGGTDLKVSATVVGTQTGAFKFVNDAVTVLGNGSEGDPDYVAPSTLANGFVYLQAKLGTTAPATPDADGKNDAIWGICTGTWDSAYNPDTDIPVTTIAATAVAKELGTLKKATLATDGTAVTSYDGASVMAIRLSGVVTEAPRTPWAETDGFTVNVSYTFKPVTTTP